MTTTVNRVFYQANEKTRLADEVVNEQPLQIIITFLDSNDNPINKQSLNYVITMRTKGDDKALIVGLLLSQGVLRAKSDLLSIEQTRRDTHNAEAAEMNTWEVSLLDCCEARVEEFSKYFQSNASCGLCGTSAIQALELNTPPTLSQRAKWLPVDAIYKLPTIIKNKQLLHPSTGGAHSAALFHFDVENGINKFISLHEDIGRHNALDKALGIHWLNLKTTCYDSLLIAVITSRISFEMVQKAVMSGVSVLIAFGAASDLAIKTAQRFDLTLIAFANEKSFSVYHGEWRIS